MTALGAGLGLALAAAAAGFTPASLFRPGDLGFWAGGFDPAGGRVFLDSGVTQATSFGQAIGQVTRAAGTLNAVQAVAGDRPILARRPQGGRRNLHPTSLPADWNADQAIRTAGQADPDGGADAVKITPTAVSAIHRIHIPFTPVASQKYTHAVWLKAAGYRFVYLNTQATLNAGVCVDLIGGTITGSGPALENAALTAGANGWFRLTYTGTGTGTAGNNVWIQVNNAYVATDTSFAGDGTSGILVWHPQIETGTAATAYQQVASTHDVTEAGRASRWALINVSSDSLPLTLPAANWTRAWVTPAGGTVIQEAGALAGAESILRAAEVSDVLYIDRGLTAGEQAALHGVWQARFAA